MIQLRRSAFSRASCSVPCPRLPFFNVDSLFPSSLSFLPHGWLVTLSGSLIYLYICYFFFLPLCISLTLATSPSQTKSLRNALVPLQRPCFDCMRPSGIKHAGGAKGGPDHSGQSLSEKILFFFFFFLQKNTLKPRVVRHRKGFYINTTFNL